MISTMIQNNNLAKGISIRDRANLLKYFYEEKGVSVSELEAECLENLKRWRQRPTLLSDELFDEYLEKTNTSPVMFGLGIKELTEEEKDYIMSKIPKEQWLADTNAILANPDLLQNKLLQQGHINFSYAMRLHLGYLEQKVRKTLKKHPTVVLTDEAIDEYIQNVLETLMDVALRTFVYDLHLHKEENALRGNDEHERFHHYLTMRFETKEKIGGFLSDYPAMTRLLAEVIHFQVDNFNEMVLAVEAEKEILIKLFALPYDFHITGLKMGAGDTHDKGKTVAILTIDQKKDIVFKPKNLIIAERFDMFIDELHKMNPLFHFYSAQKIIRDEYAFEEMVDYTECTSVEDVRHFYRKFGQVIALVYLLCGNDFHLENMIAHGRNPVLIDLETIIQNPMPLRFPDNAFSKAMMENSESVMVTGLIPIQLFENLVEDDVEGAEKGLQLSALSGKAQKLPYKILKLVNFDTDNMQFEYQEHETDDSQNIPKLNGEQIDFTEYVDEILQGYHEFSCYVRENCSAITEIVRELFDGLLVRNVIKTTQSYGDILSYSTHPICTSDYIEREKLFENLWKHSYVNSGPVRYEMRDLLRYDIPIFFNHTNSHDLVASEAEIVPDMYAQTAIERTLERISNFDEYAEQQQRDYLTTAFGLYNPNELQTVSVPTPQEKETKTDFYIDAAKNMMDRILKDSFTGNNSIVWKNLEEPTDNNYSVGVVNENFYDGVSGIYLTLAMLYLLTKDEKYRESYELAETLTAELGDEYIDSISAYYGSMCAVYPLLNVYRLNGDEKLFDTARKIAAQYMARYDSNAEHSYEWTGGLPSVIKVYCNLYQATANQEYLNFALRLMKEIDLSKIEFAGYAHGFSAAIGAGAALLACGIQGEEKAAVEQIIGKALGAEQEIFDEAQGGWLDYRQNPPKAMDMWCHGSLGIGMARLQLLNAGYQSDAVKHDLKVAIGRILAQDKTDDCICHGVFGDMEFLFQVRDTPYVSDTQKAEIDQKLNAFHTHIRNGDYQVEGLPTVPRYGLYTGLSGIVYELLRLQYPAVVPNVLSLDLLSKE